MAARVGTLLLTVLAAVASAGLTGASATGVECAVADPDYTAADVRFMQDMILHHAQGVAMTDLASELAAREDVRRLARRMGTSQQDEMQLMRRWLEMRGEDVPDTHAHRDHAEPHHPEMPGMLTAGEMARLAESTGEEFDRLFLEFMIRHHEGAMIMVEQLFATDGAGQEPEVFQFATHVTGDQRIEIARMRRMLQPSD